MERLNYKSAGAVRKRPSIGKSPDADKLVLCRCESGTGNWTLHVPGSTMDQILSGDAPVLVSGEAEWLEGSRSWSRPNQQDYAVAIRVAAALPADPVQVAADQIYEAVCCPLSRQRKSPTTMSSAR